MAECGFFYSVFRQIHAGDPTYCLKLLICWGHIPFLFFLWCPRTTIVFLTLRRQRSATRIYSLRSSCYKSFKPYRTLCELSYRTGPFACMPRAFKFTDVIVWRAGLSTKGKKNLLHVAKILQCQIAFILFELALLQMSEDRFNQCLYTEALTCGINSICLTATRKGSNN